jgi:rhodanese-related sulfurtransferase
MYLYPFIILFVISSLLFFIIKNNKNRQNKILIDVRTKQEWFRNHLPDSINIPYDQIHTLDVNKATKIVLYCNSGRRAKIAKNILKKLGYTDVQIINTSFF